MNKRIRIWKVEDAVRVSLQTPSRNRIDDVCECIGASVTEVRAALGALDRLYPKTQANHRERNFEKIRRTLERANVFRPQGRPRLKSGSVRLVLVLPIAMLDMIDGLRKTTPRVAFIREALRDRIEAAGREKIAAKRARGRKSSNGSRIGRRGKRARRSS